jgi:hypothetical protein
LLIDGFRSVGPDAGHAVAAYFSPTGAADVVKLGKHIKKLSGIHFNSLAGAETSPYAGCEARADGQEPGADDDETG